MLLTNSRAAQKESGWSDPWCAIYTRHQHEKAIAQILSAKGLEVFLPLYNTTRSKKNLYRLVLSVEILERSAAVEVDVSAVERVGSRQHSWPWGKGTYTPARNPAVGRDALLALVGDGWGGQEEE